MRLHKKEIAKRQIETGIELFFTKGDCISVITLAGASEEVLGDLLRRVGKSCVIDHLIDLDKQLTGTGRVFKVVNEEVNGIRNGLKHAKDSLEDELEIDLQHAEAMLARAVTNYFLLEECLTP